MLFEHSVDGVFFMALDEPFAWAGAANQDALLDYAFEHLRITSVNQAMCDQMVAPRERLIGSAPCDRWRDNVPVWRAKMRDLYDHGRVYHSVRAPRSDGTWMDVEGQYVCLYDDQGRITGHFGTQRDVTEKRKAVDRLELALVGGQIGIWDFDLVAEKMYFDPRWITRLGYAPDSEDIASAEWWSTRVHPSDLAESQRSFLEHVMGNAPLYHVEQRVRDASGGWLWLLTSGKVTSRDAQGRPLRMVGASVDITERKLLQEQLFLAERMASIGTLAAGVGHEINNPLTYIVLNLTLLEREMRALDLPAATLARITNMIEQARYGTDRVSGIVRDLQALTRVPEERMARVELIPVLEHCLEIADHQIRRRAHVVRHFGSVPAVRGSEGRLAQLFLNLLVNAAQAIPVGSADTNTVKVSTSTQGGRAVVAITDTGAGIPAEVLGRIFDPFYTTKPVGEGTGLGLAICRSIVTAMAGEIEVDSIPGEGTTFRVTLPAAVADVANDRAITRTSPRSERKRVLVVDDEAMVGELVARALADHEVIAETSGRAALDRLRTDASFDVILCDVMMPAMSGMDFYTELEPCLRGRVVFLSGGVFTERARTFLDSLPNRRLAKPFDLDALIAVLLSPGDHDALP